MRLRNLFAALGLALTMAFSLAGAQTAGSTKAAPKPTTAAKKQLPPRDPKTGKFIKVVPVPAGMSVAKGQPARDPKTGRFIKKNPVAAAHAKIVPARDPKTGRFIKKPTNHATDKHPSPKTTPVRDPKKGRFVKKG